MSISEKYIAELYNKIQEERPIIHCITNAVTVNDCANILLAAGASPTMAHHPLEVEEITAALCTEGSVPKNAPSITEDIHPLPVIFAILASPFSQI